MAAADPKSLGKELIEAAKDGKTKEVERLIDAGADLNVQGILDVTALIRAITKGHKEIVKALIDAGADLNIKDMLKNTALLSAVHDGHTDMAKMLIDAGADLNIKNKNGDTALMYAIRLSGHVPQTAKGQARRRRWADIVELIQKKMEKNENWAKRKDMILYRRNFRQADPNRMILTEKYKKEEEDVRTRDGPREKWLFGDGEKPPSPPAASGSGSSTGGRKKRRTRKHRGKKRKQTKRRKPRKSTRKPKRRVKKRKQTKRRRRR